MRGREEDVGRSLRYIFSADNLPRDVAALAALAVGFRATTFTALYARTLKRT